MDESFLVQPSGTFEVPNYTGPGTSSGGFSSFWDSYGSQIISGFTSIGGSLINLGAGIYGANHQMQLSGGTTNPLNPNGNTGGPTNQPQGISATTVAIGGILLLLIIIIIIVLVISQSKKTAA